MSFKRLCIIAKTLSKRETTAISLLKEESYL